MIFRETEVSGVFIVVPEPVSDERGSFINLFSAAEFDGHGIETDYPYQSASVNTAKGTLRGLHSQRPPHAEAKLVRCTSGRIFDVALDIRPESPTYKSWTTAELSAVNRHILAIPAGCAHGFLTLEDESEVAYHLSQPFVAEAVAGVRWDDPGIDIPWPGQPTVISERDASMPDYQW